MAHQLQRIQAEVAPCSPVLNYLGDLLLRDLQLLKRGDLFSLFLFLLLVLALLALLALLSHGLLLLSQLWSDRHIGRIALGRNFGRDLGQLLRRRCRCRRSRASLGCALGLSLLLLRLLLLRLRLRFLLLWLGRRTLWLLLRL